MSTPTCASVIEQRLEDLQAHREGLITELKVLADPYPPAKLEDDIALIEAGLTKLNTAATA